MKPAVDTPSQLLTSPLELSLQEVIYNSLEVLRAVDPAIELAAYLHSGHDGGPQLFLSPSTAAVLTADQAFAVFTSLREVLDRATPDAERVGHEKLEAAGFDVLAIVSGGDSSSGLYAVGARDHAVAAGDRADAIIQLAATFARLEHRIEAAIVAARAEIDNAVK